MVYRSVGRGDVVVNKREGRLEGKRGRTNGPVTTAAHDGAALSASCHRPGAGGSGRDLVLFESGRKRRSAAGERADQLAPSLATAG